MVRGGFVGIAIPQELADRIDEFVTVNKWGYRSRGDVIRQAVIEFLRREAPEHPLGPARDRKG